MKKFYLLSLFLLSISPVIASATVTTPLPGKTFDWSGAQDAESEGSSVIEPMTYQMAVAKGLVTQTEQKAEPSRAAGALKSNTSTVTTFRGFNIGLGYLQFNLARPVTRTLIWGNDSLYVTAGAAVGNDYYVIDGDLANSSAYPTRLLKVDESTGAYSVVAKYNGTISLVMTDATWDALNNRMLVAATEGSTYDGYLYKLDITNGKFTRLASYPGLRFYTIAADLDGEIYAVSQTGDLYKIDSVTYQATKLGSTGFKPTYLCSMTFDQRYHNLHWANSSSTSNLINIDLATATGTNVNYIGNSNTSYELTGMTIAYAAPNALAPNAVKNTVVTPAALGGNSARVTWTNPETTYGGTSLDNIEKIVVYIDNTAVQTLSDQKPGAAVDITLTNISSGMHAFKIVPYSKDGQNEVDGQMVEKYAWVGADLPEAPTNIVLERTSPTTAKLTWEAPGTVGTHGGYVNPESLKYRISRTCKTTGDSICIQKVYRKGLEYTDESLSESGCYFYTIQSLSSDYGNMSRSEDKFLGPAYTVPYSTNYSSDNLVELWDNYDFDGDGRKWVRGVSASYMISYSSYTEVENDNRLVSPPITLEKDSTYYVFFESYSGFSKDYPKQLSLWIGKDKDPKTHTLLKTISFADKSVHCMRYALPIEETGEYYFTVQDQSKKTSSSVKMTNFIVVTKHTGWAEGVISDKDNKPVEGATVMIPNTEISCNTDKDGKYMLDFIPAGRYAIQVSKYGYKTVNDSVDYENDKASVYNQTIYPLNTYKISGTVTDVNGDAVVNAKVKVSGYGDDRIVYTDKSGKYSLDDVYEADYTFSLLKYKYSSVSDSISLSENKTYDMVLSPKILQPSGFKAQIGSDNKAVVSWGKPLETFRHDSGIYASQTGALVGTEYYVFGAVFEDPAVIDNIDWVTTSYQGPHNYINLFIFDIDENKVPTNKILYKALNVPSKGDEVWNNYELPTPVEAPNGYYLGASYTGMVSLAMDSGTDAGWPYVEDINYSTRDYRTNVWSKVASKRNYLIRANGNEIGENVQEYAYHYKVWRFAEEDGFDESKWVLLTAEQGTTEESISDDISKLADGTYVYAIKAVYPENKETEAIFSDDVVVKNGVGGVNDVANDIIEIYPNPVKDKIYTTQEIDKAQIFTLGGNVVTEVSNTNEIDVNDLPNGIYLLHVSIDNQEIVKKIIVKK